VTGVFKKQKTKMTGEKLIDPTSRVNACISNNASSQALMSKLDPELAGGDGSLRANSSEESISAGKSKSHIKSPNHVSRQDWITLSILTFVNLINYMDRYTIAGILDDVQAQFDINNSQAGLIQTAFIVSFMIFAPIFGYMGDRYNRKYVMIVGITIWSIATLAGSFMEHYYGFLVMRMIVGIGEASYTTIAPTIISDLFVKDVRSNALAIFYFAIPVGSGMGYVVGKALAEAFGSWHWALRGTPVLGSLAVFLLVFFCEEPKRGESEGHDQLKATSYWEDLKSLAVNRSFVLSTVGCTCVYFCTGALGWWIPKFLVNCLNIMGESVMEPDNVPFIFGICTMMSGVIGVPFGSMWSTKWRPKNQRADPIICAIGLFATSVFLCAALFLCNSYFYWGFVLIFLGEVAMNLNWSIVADILLYTVIPTRRGTAEAIQILISHFAGDAGSPYLIGVISDSLKETRFSETNVCTASNSTDLDAIKLCENQRNFYSMQYAFMLNIVMVLLGAVCFIICAIYVVRDKERVERFVAGDSDNFKHEKEDMIIKSENNSIAWSSEDDVPPQIIIQNSNSSKKLEPLLKPLKYKSPPTKE
jgi:MFS family permease